MPSTTAVRITTISAAQNKRGKDCFEGGMETGAFTWFKDMGGNSNWMYVKVVNVSSTSVSLALWLLYEASTEPLVDPLTGTGSIQVGFFNQSKNLNRQVPLFELAEESKPGLEIGAGQSSTLKVRINDLSSHHQNQRFIIVIGPADAPIRGSRSVPIEIMSKPRVDSDHPSSAVNNSANDALSVGGNKRSMDDDKAGVPPLKRSAIDAATAAAESVSAPNSSAAAAVSVLSALAAVTDPSPSPERKIEVILTLLDALEDTELIDLYEKIATRLRDRGCIDLMDDEDDSSSPRQRSDERQQPSAALVVPTSSAAAVAAAAALKRDAVGKATKDVEATATTTAASSRENSSSNNNNEGTEAAAAGDDESMRRPPKLKPLVKAMLALRKNARNAASRASGGGQGDAALEQPEVPPWVNSFLERFPDDNLNLSEDQLRQFFDDDSSMSNLESFGLSSGNNNSAPSGGPPRQATLPTAHQQAPGV